ncbi:sulfotransferase [Microbulbifer sp. ZKSA004]|uniref:sulfotransferase n=1 Tax=Microbulbifer sp. ZKSA004 TaxID=3243389 RepID=UPI00403A2903
MQRDQQATIKKLFHSAQAAISQSQPQLAQQLLQKALTIDSGHANIWHLLADSHCRSQGLPMGISTLKSAITQHKFPPTEIISLQIHLTSLYIKSGDLGEAASCIDLDTLIRIQDPILAGRAGYLLAICEEHKSALTALEAALLLNPSNPELLFNAASTHRALGNLKTAEKIYDQAIKLAPSNFPAYWLRSTLRKQTKDNNHTQELEQLISKDSTPNTGKIQLQFALAKELEDLNQFKNSFLALKLGSQLKKENLGYKVESDLSAIDEIRKTYNFDSINSKPNKKNGKGENIIFILGMPRTGSTLVDRILCSNNQVNSAGEPDTFGEIFYRAAMQASGIQSLNSDSQVQAIRKSININFEELGRVYENKLEGIAKQKNSLFIIDKNPSNFLYIGAIKLALPKAKIIHINRDPMDTCYAIFKTLFKYGHPYSYCMEDLARYYIAYRKLMSHWNNLFEGEYLELRYEELVQSPRTTSKILMSYCNLDWTEECLDFHNKKDKGTATASAAQVRKPIYTSSLGLWKNYKQELEPLRKILAHNNLL